MSRAFTKEDDAGDDLPERPISWAPNYMTPRGVRLMKTEAQALLEKKKKAQAEGGDTRPFDRDLRYLEARVNSALVVPPGAGHQIRFGAVFTIENEKGERSTYQIVGEDEARTDSKFIAWTAPLVNELFGAEPGEIINCELPEGNQKYKVIEVHYESGQ